MSTTLTPRKMRDAIRAVYVEANEREVELFDRWKQMEAIDAPDKERFWQDFLDAANRSTGAWKAYTAAQGLIDADALRKMEETATNGEHQ